MPDANGSFKGHGWSRAYEDAHARIFGPRTPPPLSDQPDDCCGEWFNDLPCSRECLTRVPAEPSPEVEHLADRTAAEADGWTPEDYDQERSAGPPVRFQR